MAKKILNLAILTTVAKELQDLCEFDPPIKTKGKTEDELKKVITEAGGQLAPEDELSEDAVFVFNELGISVGEEAAEEAEEVEEEEAPVATVAKKAVAKKAPVAAAAKEEEEEDEAPVAAKKAPAAKKAAATVKLSSEEKIAYFAPLIEEGTHTMKDLVAKSLEKFPGLSESSIRTFLVDSKNTKYNKFPKLVVADDEGKLSFAAPAKKKA
jgi:hypothetical protein